jgi:hypothetical protein
MCAPSLHHPQNRDRKLAPTKVYNMSHIYTSAAAGALVPPEGKEQHDVRGTPSLLKAYASTPDLLEPQVRGQQRARRYVVGLRPGSPVSAEQQGVACAACDTCI